MFYIVSVSDSHFTHKKFCKVNNNHGDITKLENSINKHI